MQSNMVTYLSQLCPSKFNRQAPRPHLLVTWPAALFTLPMAQWVAIDPNGQLAGGWFPFPEQIGNTLWTSFASAPLIKMVVRRLRADSF